MKRAAILAATGTLVFAVGLASASALAAVDGTQGQQRYQLTTAQGEFTSGTHNQGWWSNNPLANQDDNDNYVVGHFGTDEYRDFFSFDLTPVAGHILSAKLVVHRGWVYGDPVEQLSLFDVTTPAATVNNNIGPSQDIFADLGTGTNYGDFPVDTTKNKKWLRLPLDRAAVLDLNRSAGQYFTIGGRLTSSTHSDEFEALFGHTGRHSARLIVRTTQ